MLDELRRSFDNSVLEIHPHYRTAIGVLGAALPVVASAYSLLRGEPIESSISAYYHTGARDWLVGILWVIGFFLIFYQYKPRQVAAATSRFDSVRTGAADSWLGKVAGIAAIIVALVPTPAENGAPTIGNAHGWAAGILFVCLALFPLLLFSQSRTRRWLYRLYGVLMLLLVAALALYTRAPEAFKLATAEWKLVFYLEAALVGIFALSWFQRGLELAARQRANVS